MSDTVPVITATPSGAAGAFPGGLSGFASPPGAPAALGSRRQVDYRFILLWAIAWAVVGALVAGGLALATDAVDALPILSISVLMAEVVGFTALTSARLIFPMFTRMPIVARAALQVLTLFSGTVFGSFLVVTSMPLFSLARVSTVALVILVNAALAVIVGISLHTYEEMRRQIEGSYRTLREKEAIERQVQIALEVQRELFPKRVPAVRGLQLAGVCQPAVGVGGDYYDFIEMGEERVGIVIADVSGKGIPAALLMAALQASVRGLCLPETSAAEMNGRLNDVLYRSTSAARYATLFFGIFDGREGRLTFSNAGHNPPLCIGGNGAARLVAGGIPLGVLLGSRYEQDARPLASGDILALYTDGVTEAPNPQGEEFGEERLIAVLQRNRERSVDELIPIVLDEVRRWSGGAAPHDDLTLVLARAA